MPLIQFHLNWQQTIDNCLITFQSLIIRWKSQVHSHHPRERTSSFCFILFPRCCFCTNSRKKLAKWNLMFFFVILFGAKLKLTIYLVSVCHFYFGQCHFVRIAWFPFLVINFSFLMYSRVLRTLTHAFFFT